MWPSYHSGFSRRLNRELLLRQILPAIVSVERPIVAVTTIPLVADLVGALPVSGWVYYCLDDYEEWPGLDKVTLRSMEAALVGKVDALIAVSETIREKFASKGKVAHLLTHGTDLDHWLAEGDGSPPCLPIGLERPLVMFWGLVDRRMDVSFLERLGMDLVQGTIVLVGPEAGPDPALDRVPRLVKIPPVSYEELPRLAREAQVLIMPYADLPVTRAMQPLKLKEYLATGKSVVVRDLPATRSWADCLDLTDTPESFSETVRRRLVTGLPVLQKKARERLGDEGWRGKAAEFERRALDPFLKPNLTISS